MGPRRLNTLSTGIEKLFFVGAGTLNGGIMAGVASGLILGEKASGLLGSKIYLIVVHKKVMR
jgi:phytoene dehydrogenase-like protein